MLFRAPTLRFVTGLGWSLELEQAMEILCYFAIKRETMN